MIIQRKYKRKCIDCGDKFHGLNVEQFKCPKCAMKGQTYVEFKP